MRLSLAAVLAASTTLALGAIGCGSSNGTSEPPPATAPPGFFGVVPQGPLTTEDIERMDKGNVGTLRIVIPWGGLDTSPAPNESNYSTIDPVVLLAAQHDIRVIPTVYGTPEWIAKDLDNASCGDNCSAFAPRSPKALAAWGDFLGELVARYGPGGTLWSEHPEVDDEPLRLWQLWNEQNSPTFYQPAVDPAGYAALVRSGSVAITKRDPQAEVMLGGMFGTPPPGERAWDFLRELYEIGDTRDYFDAVAAHPYAAQEEGIEPQVMKLRKEVVRAGDEGTEMWITEVGSSSDTGPNPLERGPEGQAAQLREAFEFFLEHREALDLEGVEWYSWRDTADDSQCDWCPGSGLFEAESLTTPKLAWEEFVSFTGGS